LREKKTIAVGLIKSNFAYSTTLKGKCRCKPCPKFLFCFIEKGEGGPTDILR
jgi:hypothetical protein